MKYTHQSMRVKPGIWVDIFTEDLPEWKAKDIQAFFDICYPGEMRLVADKKELYERKEQNAFFDL